TPRPRSPLRPDRQRHAQPAADRPFAADQQGTGSPDSESGAGEAAHVGRARRLGGEPASWLAAEPGNKEKPWMGKWPSHGFFFPMPKIGYTSLKRQRRAFAGASGLCGWIARASSPPPSRQELPFSAWPSDRRRHGSAPTSRTPPPGPDWPAR